MNNILKKQNQANLNVKSNSLNKIPNQNKTPVKQQNSKSVKNIVVTKSNPNNKQPNSINKIGKENSNINNPKPNQRVINPKIKAENINFDKLLKIENSIKKGSLSNSQKMPQIKVDSNFKGATDSKTIKAIKLQAKTKTPIQQNKNKNKLLLSNPKKIMNKPVLLEKGNSVNLIHNPKNQHDLLIGNINKIHPNTSQSNQKPFQEKQIFKVFKENNKAIMKVNKNISKKPLSLNVKNNSKIEGDKNAISNIISSQKKQAPPINNKKTNKQQNNIINNNLPIPVLNNDHKLINNINDKPSKKFNMVNISNPFGNNTKHKTYVN